MIKCWLVFLAVRYRVIFDFFEFVLRMNEVISLNVVFLNLFQRKLRCEVHMDALFFQFFWIYLFEHTRSQFFVKRCWNEQRFRNHSVNFGIVLEKCEVCEDDTLHCLSVWKTQKTILQFRAECPGLWIGARLEVTLFLFLQIVLFSRANEPVHGLVYMRITRCADK